MSELIVHPFEAGRRGKPDELESNLAQLLGASLLSIDRKARFDLRVFGSYVDEKPAVHISGEVSGSLPDAVHLQERFSTTVRQHYNIVHRSSLPAEGLAVHCCLKPQDGKLEQNENAGDSGYPIAVAYRKGPHFLPWERFLAVRIRNVLDDIYHSDGTVPRKLAERSGTGLLYGLGADGKVGVEALYEGAQLKGISDLTIGAQHSSLVNFERFVERAERTVRSVLDASAEQYDTFLGNPSILINGLGPFTEGGWKVDEGNREAKSYRDGFGSYGCMEDSFAGEDPSKPSGTGTFLARYIAVQLVGNGLADFARVALRYQIGREEVGLNITTQGTGNISQEELHALVRGKIPLCIGDTIERFGLRDPALYRQIAEDSDFFHNPELPWNKVEVEF